MKRHTHLGLLILIPLLLLASGCINNLNKTSMNSLDEAITDDKKGIQYSVKNYELADNLAIRYTTNHGVDEKTKTVTPRAGNQFLVLRVDVWNKYVHETHDFNDAFPRIYDIKLIHKDTPAKPVDAAKLLEPNSTRYSLIFNGKNRVAYGDQYNFLEQEYEEYKKQAPYGDVKSTAVHGRIAYEVPKTFNPENAYVVIETKTQQYYWNLNADWK